MLPVCVILPVYECAERLRRHLENAVWVEEAEQIVVVDSDSKDGTAEIAREFVASVQGEFLSVPPGLYAAWNAGVAQARTPFAYYSTIGDTISVEGLRHLCETAENLECDVVISPPNCVPESGEAVPRREFPIHQLLARAGISGAVRLEPAIAYLFASGFSVESILGSSASNLYRAEILRRYPFPVEFGKAGDTAWMRRNALRVRTAITPRVCADFLLHQDHGSRKHGELSNDLERLNEESFLALQEYLTSHHDEESRQLRLLEAWRSVTGAAPENTLDAIRHLEGIAEKNAEQRAYIGDLQAEIEKMRQGMKELTQECERREAELDQLRSKGPAAVLRASLKQFLKR